MRVYLTAFLLLCTAASSAAVQEKTVDYSAGKTHLKGYLAWDDARSGPRPGVLVVHEWWGLNDYARKRARMLAELGYTALAVDMYGDGQNTEHPEDAKRFMDAVLANAGAAKERFLAAKSLLEKQPDVEPGKIAAIGYCFGGATVLNMARQGVDLAAVASFHGNLATTAPATKGSVKGRVLVLNGADDGWVTAESIKSFEKEMTEAGANYKFISYPGAKHGFSNPDADRLGKAANLPIGYNADADQKSWAVMQDLFREVFRTGKP